jgi:hypothetical protein
VEFPADERHRPPEGAFVVLSQARSWPLIIVG